MKNTLIKTLASLVFVVMVAVNFLANSLPINNRSTGDISDAYPNLFAPAGPAFSIWGLIYILLAGYVLYQFFKVDSGTERVIRKINPFFIVSSIANMSWIFAWHYDHIGISVLIMSVLLVSLVKIADILRAERYSGWKKLFLWAPFSVYFGWITVATIANVTVFLVSVGWNGFGISDAVWTSIILFVGALIGIARMRKDKNIIYGGVLVWAYAWILFKHFSPTGFDGQYPGIIASATVCLALFILFIGRTVFERRKRWWQF